MTGSDLQATRIRNGLSRTHLAGLAGISPYTVRYHERRGCLDLRGWAVRRMLSAMGQELDERYFPEAMRARHGVWTTPALTAPQSRPGPGSTFCGAKTRAGHPCRSKQLYKSGKCRNHGGLSTGPRADAGKAAIARSNRHRALAGKL